MLADEGSPAAVSLRLARLIVVEGWSPYLPAGR
ncbi:MAG: hypothetical protein RIQ93_1451, partial [Verrucomicrobiota bacterium]